MSYRQRGIDPSDVRSLGILSYRMSNSSCMNRAQNFHNLNWTISKLDGGANGSAKQRTSLIL